MHDDDPPPSEPNPYAEALAFAERAHVKNWRGVIVHRWIANAALAVIAASFVLSVFARGEVTAWSAAWSGGCALLVIAGRVIVVRGGRKGEAYWVTSVAYWRRRVDGIALPMLDDERGAIAYCVHARDPDMLGGLLALLLIGGTDPDAIAKALEHATDTSTPRVRRWWRRHPVEVQW